MIIGNEEQLIYSVVARWAGSTNDSRVWHSAKSRLWTERRREWFLAGFSNSKLS
jgi:hypothetical protein